MEQFKEAIASSGVDQIKRSPHRPARATSEENLLPYRSRSPSLLSVQAAPLAPPTIDHRARSFLPSFVLRGPLRENKSNFAQHERERERRTDDVSYIFIAAAYIRPQFVSPAPSFLPSKLLASSPPPCTSIAYIRFLLVTL